MGTIYISPSTQEHNVGVGSYGTEEIRMNQIADVVCNCLNASRVPYFRNTPNMTLSQVIADSNSKKPDIHFAIHSNAGGGTGTEVHIYGKGQASEVFANKVYSAIEPLTPTADRGIKVSPLLSELKNTGAQAALIELAFHDNAGDAAFIINNIQAIGIALAKAICSYFGVAFVDPYYVAPAPVVAPVTAQAPSGRIYRVQVGAYSVKTNADNMAAKLKASGFEAVIV